eukprot:m.202805 g.202805  ORF g.202805 m.202805 type:complete len:267 (+) comp21917_c0_seq1:82-882(+)
MRDNEFVTLAGRTVQLVPYMKRHVLKYHGWMQSEELLALTASERLTLDKEYEMQQSWRDDADKCTFIILHTGRRASAPTQSLSVTDPSTASTAPPSVEGSLVHGVEALTTTSASEVMTAMQTEVDKASSGNRTAQQTDIDAEMNAMVGDVNLFLNDPHDTTAAEIDVMVAEPTARGCGVGREAVLLMMHYGMTRLKLEKFVAKIDLDNAPSLGLFTKLGFVKVSECTDFNEATLELSVAPPPTSIETLWTEVSPIYSDYTLPDDGS